MCIILPILISLITFLFNIAITLEIIEYVRKRDESIQNQINKLYEKRNNIHR